ncbi:MAG: hypothetical protein ABJB47_08065 [Actinomycetota bacterium]
MAVEEGLLALASVAGRRGPGRASQHPVASGTASPTGPGRLAARAKSLIQPVIAELGRGYRAAW